MIELARALRENQRRMPVLRDEAEWQRATACLRTAWGKLEKALIPSRRRLSLDGPPAPFLEVDPRSDLTPLKRNRRIDAFSRRCEILDAQRELEL